MSKKPINMALSARLFIDFQCIKWYYNWQNTRFPKTSDKYTEAAKKEAEKVTGEKPITQKMFKAI